MVTAASTRVAPTLIVGLGNPGPKYQQTRHNIGFAAVDALAARWQISLSTHTKFQAEFGEGLVLGNHRVRLLKPSTYMNNSGQSIRAALDWYKLPPQAVLILSDDLDLPLGKIRLRPSGSAGGHNGIRSAIAHLGTQDFPRLRIGIGSPPELAPGKKDTVSYVLSRFLASEKQLLPEVLQLVVAALELSLKQNLEKAMSLYNSQTVTGAS